MQTGGSPYNCDGLFADAGVLLGFLHILKRGETWLVWPRHGNNALGFRRYMIQIPYGSSIRVFDTDHEFQLGNILEPATYIGM